MSNVHHPNLIGRAAPVILAGLLSWPLATEACSPVTDGRPFQAGDEAVRSKPDSRSRTLPAPRVKKVQLSRSSSFDGRSCGDFSTLRIALEWPRNAPARARDVGFYFTPVDAERWQMIFDQGPVAGRVEKNVVHFSFVWIEGVPRQWQDPLDFDLEIVAVDRYMRRGQPVRVRISDSMAGR